MGKSLIIICGRDGYLNTVNATNNVVYKYAAVWECYKQCKL